MSHSFYALKYRLTNVIINLKLRGDQPYLSPRGEMQWRMDIYVWYYMFYMFPRITCANVKKYNCIVYKQLDTFILIAKTKEMKLRGKSSTRFFCSCRKGDEMKEWQLCLEFDLLYTFQGTWINLCAAFMRYLTLKLWPQWTHMKLRGQIFHTPAFVPCVEKRKNQSPQT